MTQESKKSGGGVVDSVRDAVSKNPAADRLVSELETFARNRMLGLVDSLGDRIGDVTDRLEGVASNGGTVTKAAKNAAQGDSPLKAGAKAVGSTVKDKIGGMLGGKGSGGSSLKATLIEETIDIGVPVSTAYNQWTQFQEFGRFTKGVQSVSQDDETTTTWKAKVAFSTRSWKAEIKEQIPDEKIAWTADGDKGSVNGVVTFHELAPNLTRVLLELEYHPKGLFEKTGNLWRAQGRRARLDLKNFRWYVMSQGEESGAWRGEIRDGEVTESSDEGGGDNDGGDGGDGESRRGRGSDDSSSGERSSRQRRPRGDRPRPRRDREQRSRGSSDRGDRSDRGERRARGSARERSSGSNDGDQGGGGNREERPSRRRAASRRRSGRGSDSESRDNGGDTGGAADDGSTSGAAAEAAAKKSTSRRRSPAKKTATQQPATKQSGPRKRTPAKKTATKQSGPRKTTAKKSTPAKTSSPAKTSTRSQRSPDNRTTAKKTTAKKTAAKKTAAKRSTPRKSAARKTAPARKTTGRKTTGRKTSTARRRSSSK